MIVQSREKRAKVTEQIKDTLITLVEKEKDFEKKKKHPAIWYREAIAQVLNLSEHDNPSLRSYEEALKPVRAKFREKNPLDEHWTIGASAKYNISPDILPILLSIAQVLNQSPPSWVPAEVKPQLPFSIRQALWISRLYPLLSKAAERTKPGNSKAQYAIMFIIASQYAWKERTAEVMGKTILDTTDLDEIYFTHENPVDINKGFFSVVLGWEYKTRDGETK